MEQTSRTQISNPFETPRGSLPQSSASSYLEIPTNRGNVPQSPLRSENEKQEYPQSNGKFRSYRLVGPYEQPWLKDRRNRRDRYGNYIVYAFAVLGLALSGVLCWDAARKVVNHDYCLVLDEQFEQLDASIWNREVQTDGFGTGSFDWTTTDDANSHVEGNMLWITPTLTNETTTITEPQILNGYTLNLTTDKTCTSTDYHSCSVRSNSSTGPIINPVRSARITTQGKKTIKYGRVEVVAKMPKGDWLWPAVWLMPEDSVYGTWPRSGEIDIFESRGNDKSYANGGRNVMTSALHWGPSSEADGFLETSAAKSFKRVDYTEGYHTFGLEWSKNYLYVYLDSRLLQIKYIGFEGETMWQRGHFSTAQTANGSLYTDPWSATGNLNTPFDQSFYLILNVAVGSNNGWFEDGVGGKPWVDKSTTAARDFWSAVDKWFPTWGSTEDHSMTVKSVKMWQEGACA